MIRLMDLAAHLGTLARRFIAWTGPFGVAVTGMFLLMVGVATDDNLMGISVVGGLMVLSSLELYAERAESKERERWAKLIAGFFAKEGNTTFEVKHSFQSIRPELDELIAQEVQTALRARAAGDAS